MPIGISNVSNPDVEASDQRLIDNRIERIARLDGTGYRTDADGSVIIHDTEQAGGEYAAITDYGLGFQGFCGKLHGTHARLALILHLLDDPAEPIIPATTVQRAGRLTNHFVLPHTRAFYDTVPSANIVIARDIAGWLLTKAPPRIRASDFCSGVAACKGMVLKRLHEVLDPLDTGGWLEQEEPGPANRAWALNPEVKPFFADREKFEAQRRADARNLLRRISGADSSAE